MGEDVQIVYVDKPEWGIIGPAIQEFNTQQAGDDRAHSLCFVLRRADREVVGGVIGVVYWNWLSVELLWVKEELRGHGYGHRLLTLAEEEAHRRGATHAHLDTFSFQAPDFYKRHGYEVFGDSITCSMPDGIRFRLCLASGRGPIPLAPE